MRTSPSLPARPCRSPRGRPPAVPGIRAFTLIELMVVVTILAIMTTYAVINLDLLVPSTRLEAATKHLGSTMALAHDQAVISGKRHGMGFDFKRRQYWIILPPQEKILIVNGKEFRYTEKDEMPPETLPGGVSFQDLVVSSQEKFTDGKVEIAFHPSGSGEGVAVHLRNEAGDRYTLELPPLTGIPVYQEGEVSSKFVIDEEKK